MAENTEVVRVEIQELTGFTSNTVNIVSLRQSAEIFISESHGSLTCC